MGFGGVGDGGGAGRASRGHVLLLAADAAVRRGAVLLAPGANVAALAMVPADLLLGSGLPADMVCLEGVRDPNTVLARLQAAAAAAGPVFVYVSGRLTADRRGRRLFVALAGTTPGSVRYTSLPWEWLAGELRARPAGTATVVVDLVADRGAWPPAGEWLGAPDPSGPAGSSGPAGVQLFGVVRGPDAPAQGGGVSAYTRQWIDHLRRAPVRPSDMELHALAAGSAGLAPGTLVLPSARDMEGRRAPARGRPRHEPPAVAEPADAPLPEPVPVPVSEPAVPAADTGAGAAAEPDPRALLHALAVGGRHGEADVLARTWERGVVQRSGRASPEAVRCTEIRADLARMAGDFEAATRLWTAAGRARLQSQGAHAAEVREAAAGALYCWTQVKDRSQALATGPELVALLREVPLPDPGHLRLAERRLEALATPDRSRAAHP
ncbi:hypothetical protein [Streptomyces sp. NRRL F-2664]|uniref:hypothetical protein n=1 Tax=Streptomyces sp. NRRL F-2664 TaxID=1463842 RepID=UPI0004C47BF8|nr:hypothetical protein [Streptomyces sp. NRRL F-2664]